MPTIKDSQKVSTPDTITTNVDKTDKTKKTSKGDLTIPDSASHKKKTNLKHPDEFVIPIDPPKKTNLDDLNRDLSGITNPLSLNDEDFNKKNIDLSTLPEDVQAFLNGKVKKGSKEDKFFELFHNITTKMSTLEYIPDDLKEPLINDFKKIMSSMNGNPQNLDIDSVTTQLMIIQTKFQDERIKFSQKTIEIGQVDQNQISDKRIDKIRDSIQKMEEAMKSSLIGKIFGYIAFALTAVFAAVMFATGVGAVAGGFMLAAVALSASMLISSETNNCMMTMFGNSEDAQIGAMVFWTSLSIALSLGTAAASSSTQAAANTAKIASKTVTKATATTAQVAKGAKGAASVSVSAANEAADASQKTARSILIANRIKQFSQLTAGGAKTAEGGAGMATTQFKYEADMLKVDTHKLQGEYARIQQQIDDTIEALSEAIKSLNNGYNAITESYKASHETKIKLSKNLRT